MTTFTLREMQPKDNEAVNSLVTEIGGFMSTQFIVDAYRVMIEYAELRTEAVVAEAEGFDGLAGVASVRFGECQFNGAVLPFAFLDSLKVDERFRRQGLGAKLAQWRVDRARAENGDQGLLLSGTTTDNIASQNTMKKWCREFTDPLTVLPLTTRSSPPRAAAGVTAREAQPPEYAALAEQQNAFYRDYNLYSPTSPKRLTEEQTLSPTAEPLTKHYVAVTVNGDIIAGASTRYRGGLMVDQMNPPLPLRIANLFLRMIPPDYILRDVQVKGLWFASGQEAAARYLLDSLRHAYHPKGAIMSLVIDPRSPFASLIKPTRFAPDLRIVCAIHGPALLERERLLYNLGRV